MAAGTSDRTGLGALAPAAVPLLMAAFMAGPVAARTLLSLDEALVLVFPPPAKVTTKTIVLSSEQAERVAVLAHESPARRFIVRYEARIEGRPAGVAYVDTRVVRTLPASILFVVRGDPAVIERVELLSWNEPPDYSPRKRFAEQLVGRKLDSRLSLKRSIRPMTGATLTSRALTAAARRVLAIHAVIAEAAGK